jgi:hypothetical protein
MDDDQQNPSADDMFEAERQDQLNHSVGDQPLAEDNDSPAAPADDNGDEKLSADHPSHDSNVDESERYEGEV